MGFTWHQTKFKGLRYREHPSRRHGVRLDRCYQVRFLLDGKRVEETLGWSSENWTEEKAALKLGELREAHRTGQGERTLAEKRQKAQAKRKAEEAAKAAKVQEALTFGELFESHYWPHALGYKTPGALTAERSLYDKWIAPVLGAMPMKDAVPFHIDKIRKAMNDAGLAPRSFDYVLAVVRQSYNFALAHEHYHGGNPVDAWKLRERHKGGKKNRYDNRRTRYLSQDEAQVLLDELARRSADLHDQALLALHCGLRASEIFRLTWADVDIDRQMLTLLDTKSGATKQTFLTEQATAMLSERKKSTESHLVFPGRGSKRITSVSRSFDRAVEKLGFNVGVQDRRQRVVFHSLRHSFASWLAEKGVDLLTIKELLGHSTLRMAERYSHLQPEKLRRAVNDLGEELKHRDKAKVVNLHRD